MKLREGFGLAVRVLGLVFLFFGLRALPVAVIQLWSSLARWRVEEMIQLFTMTGWPLLLAWFLIKHSSFITDLGYPDDGTKGLPPEDGI